ncbi:transposase domain-containing protein [Streptosporangium sp. NPDC006007]|uniref:transposase domain-containing protein n=1 Tax=Streptosporangium sp. NPDC006007 TaxID=3154575 RepID=UPI0033AC40CC
MESRCGSSLSFPGWCGWPRGCSRQGHLGELTQVVPFELVDAVPAETGRVQHRLREPPSRVGVYFLPAMCLFPEVGYRLVWDKMTSALAGLPAVVSPTAKAFATCVAGWAAGRCGRCSRCCAARWRGR